MIRTFPEFIRECIWELEEGEEGGTPHVQGFFRLKTQQRISFLLKHFLARAHYTGLTTDEYKQNMKAYAQKQDATATSAVVQQRNTDPILFPAVLPEMIVEEIMEDFHWSGDVFHWKRSNNVTTFDKAYDLAIKRLVTKYRVETIVVRPDIRSCVRLFLDEISYRLINKRDAIESTTEFDRGDRGDDNSTTSQGSTSAY